MSVKEISSCNSLEPRKGTPLRPLHLLPVRLRLSSSGCLAGGVVSVILHSLTFRLVRVGQAVPISARPWTDASFHLRIKQRPEEQNPLSATP